LLGGNAGENWGDSGFAQTFWGEEKFAKNN